MSGVELERTLLFLGAGASVGKPTSLPDFSTLASGVLNGIGWSQDPRGGAWTRGGYGEFRSPTMAPEVLFGSLARFGIRFAEQVAEVLRDGEPSAVHQFAAAVLRASGLVWTTNMDCGVERACGWAVSRAGRASLRAPSLLQPLTAAGPGTLVKLHGTAEAPATLAFTDHELLAPLPEDVCARLASLAVGRVVVLYGYAGADADLAHLLERVFAGARELIWFQPSGELQDAIHRAFPDARPRFVPEIPVDDQVASIKTTAGRFLELVQASGVMVQPRLVDALLNVDGRPGVPPLELRASGLAHARLIERFGAPKADTRAIVTARWDDLQHLRVQTVPGHVRWVVTSSLYNDGVIATLIGWLASHRRVLAALRPRRLRDYAITRACALRLRARKWDDIYEIATWATSHRDNASDYYYRAHARRYAFEIEGARADAERASLGLSVAEDPERHAGAVLEEGILAIYQGRFRDSLRAAFELRERTGRYAIPRWRAWGAWLEAVTCCYLRSPDQARSVLVKGASRFDEEGLAGAVADVRTVRLLADRIDLALGRIARVEVELDDVQTLGGRYLDDRLLLAADVQLARGQIDRARELLWRVFGNPSCPTARVWASLGLAEVGRLTQGNSAAADRFAEIGESALSAGGIWLAVQAAIGLRRCGDARAHDLIVRLPRDVLDNDALDPVGEPRVLWMMTT